MVNAALPQLVWHGPIQALAEETTKPAIILKNVKHDDHLRKNQHTMTFLLETKKQLIKQYHLPRSAHQHRHRVLRSVCQPPLLVLSAGKQIRMVAALFQFHNNVQERRLSAASIRSSSGGIRIDFGKISRKDPSIILLLQGGHPDAQHRIRLLRHRLLDIAFLSTQDVRLQLGVKRADRIGIAESAERILCVKFVRTLVLCRVQKKQKRPKLPYGVLQWCACDQKPICRSQAC
mmetsp:Transcript_8653/g.22738  ORF Transcript_8653/g.22738 Transcript_8653/m.22738 type:complete len:233 (-) Transcript_8653:407-1105(-)